MRRPAGGRRRRRRSFNPHPTRRPDAAAQQVGHRFLPLHVSILTRPEGRMRRVPRSLPRSMRPFQSSPDPKAGCGSGWTWLPTSRHVSILTRPEGRMRRWRNIHFEHSCPRFNPHPTRRPDAARGLLAQQRASAMKFQSSPDPKAGCGPLPPGRPPDRQVSILTRPEGRMRRCRSSPSSPFAGFNPHPTRRPDAALSAGPSLRILSGFNPHPTRRPDAARGRRRRWWTWARFQSSPDPKAGCGRHRRMHHQLQHRVSILTRPEGRMRPG